MNFHEIDWRISPTQRVIEALSLGLATIEEEFQRSAAIDSSHFYFDPDDALEHVENLLGIAFVTAQTYITGTVSDISKLIRSEPIPRKGELLRNFADHLPESNITTMELCDAIANYWKHHEEWDDWIITDRNRRTIEILQSVGIRRETLFPCHEASKILWPDTLLNIQELIDLISDWRSRVIDAYRQ